MCLGRHVIKTWSSSQQTIALSSGEAELYALTKGACHTKWLISMLSDFKVPVDGKVCTDASTAIGIAFRRGLGRTRHIDVQYLWIQAEVADGKLQVQKVGTKSNPADLLTKAVNQDNIHRHLKALGIQVDMTRAAHAPRPEL